MNSSNPLRFGPALFSPAKLLFVVANLAISTAAAAQTLATGDARTVSMPVYPVVCVSVPAHFKSSARSSPPSVDDTARLQSLIDQCANTGKSVVLATSGSNDAFHTGQLKLAGVGLVIQSGVTLYGNDSCSSASDRLDFTGKDASLMGPGVVGGRQDFVSGTPRLVDSHASGNFAVRSEPS